MLGESSGRDDADGPFSLTSNGMNPRDTEVIRLIEQEELTSFTFEGLKRRTGAHPETLSRALDRLEEGDVVEKADEGYRLTSKARQWLSVHPAYGTERRMVLVRTMLPPSVTASELFSALRGRWFGRLRWLGYSDTLSETVLKWVTADGRVQLDAKVVEGEMTIEGVLLKGDDAAEAVRASHELVAFLSRSYARPRPRQRLLFDLGMPTLAPN